MSTYHMCARRVVRKSNTDLHGPTPPAPWARLPTKAADSDELVALGRAQTLPVGWLTGWLATDVIVVQSGWLVSCPFAVHGRCPPQL